MKQNNISLDLTTYNYLLRSTNAIKETYEARWQFINEYLQEINIQKHILLIGDLNEDTLHNKSKPIETYLEKQGFKNIFNN